MHPISIFCATRAGDERGSSSESPLVNGVYGKHFVQGFQSPTAGSGYRRANAVVKHGFAYNLEVDTDSSDAQANVDRHHFNAKVSQRELSESYLYQFKQTVQTADPAGVMCSYNAINGIPACTNEGLLNGTLRGQFGFRGVVASDCGAITDAFKNHNYTRTLAAAAKLALKASVDSNCGSAYSKTIPQMVADGMLSEDDYKPNVKRILESRLRLGLLDGISDFNAPLSSVDSVAHQRAALQAAREGIVMLQK